MSESGYSNSYDEHYRKAVRALGDPKQVYAIRGWIGDCRHFAQKAYEKGGDEELFNKRLSALVDIEQENERIAREHGY